MPSPSGAGAGGPGGPAQLGELGSYPWDATLVPSGLAWLALRFSPGHLRVGDHRRPPGKWGIWLPRDFVLSQLL